MNKCEVCEIIGGKKSGLHNKKYIIELEGGWTLNHHGDPIKGYLGYLVLSTKDHIIDFNKLPDKEAKYLGVHIQQVNKVLRDYWEEFYPKDPIQRIYSVYLNETPYIKHLKGNAVDCASHVHIHLIPRTKKMGEICYAQKLGWEFLNTIGCFPKYVLCEERKKKALILYLKEHLEARPATKNE